MSATRLYDPYYLARRALKYGIMNHATSMEGVLIDVGCGTQPYRSLFNNCHYVGLEVTQASKYGSAKCADVLYDGSRLPIADSTIDAVFSSQVLEHVFAPQQFLDEIHRVLKPKGRLLLTTPFVWDEHEQPYDFARYTSFGLTHILESAGFEEIEVHKTLADASILIQLALCILYKGTRHWPRFLRTPTRAGIAIPANLIGLLLQKTGPVNSDLYLDNIVMCRKT